MEREIYIFSFHAFKLDFQWLFYLHPGLRVPTDLLYHTASAFLAFQSSEVTISKCMQEGDLKSRFTRLRFALSKGGIKPYRT